MENIKTNPMNDAYEQILRSYNPLEIKDILLHGASRKATKHKMKMTSLHTMLTTTKAYITTYLMPSLSIVGTICICNGATIKQTRHMKIQYYS